MIRLEDYGFTPYMMAGHFTENCARVTAVHKERYALICEHGEVFGRLKSSVYYNNETV